MTQTQQQTQQQRQTQVNRQVLLDLTALLATGVLGYVMLARVRTMLLRLLPDIGYDAASFLATLTAGGNAVGNLGVPSGPCQTIEAEHAPAWLALYLVTAADRLSEALTSGDAAVFETAKVAEERYYRLHLLAEERRMRAAALQDMAALLNSDREGETETKVKYLGWRAVLDNRTTFECASANGLNFRADQMPIIGFPGSVHLACRCSAGPAVPGAGILPSV